MPDTQVRPTERVDNGHLQDAREVLRTLEIDPDRGLSTSAAAARLMYGPNTVRPEAKPSRLQITAAQLPDPMKLMLGFVAMALATAFAGFIMRRGTAACWTGPLLQPALLTIGAVVPVVLSTEIDFLPRWLLTTELTGPQWLPCLGRATVFAAAVEAKTVWRRHRGSYTPNRGIR